MNGGIFNVLWNDLGVNMLLGSGADDVWSRLCAKKGFIFLLKTRETAQHS